MLKTIGQVVIVLTFVFVVYLIWQNTGRQIKNAPRYAQPEAINEISTSDLKVLPPKPGLTKIDAGSSKELMEDTYRYIFDSIQLTRINYDQLKQSDLLNVDAAFIESMLGYSKEELAKDYNSRKNMLLLVGTLLTDTNQAKIIVKYLYDNDLWTKQTARSHYLLMQYPNDGMARNAYLLLVREAGRRQILDLFEEIEFLYRRAGDEYYSTYPKTIDRLDAEMLAFLKDKVDDYRWWAAYPEKDACDAIDKILRSKK